MYLATGARIGRGADGSKRLEARNKTHQIGGRAEGDHLLPVFFRIVAGDGKSADASSFVDGDDGELGGIDLPAQLALASRAVHVADAPG